MQRTRVRAVALPVVAGGCWLRTRGEKQIPFGNDNKKGKSKNKSRSRFPVGMSIACSGGAFARWRSRWSRGEWAEDDGEQQIHCGKDNKKGKGKSKGEGKGKGKSKGKSTGNNGGKCCLRLRRGVGYGKIAALIG